MTDRETVFDVQWALYGSTPGEDGHSLLGHSTGSLGRLDFLDAITRIQLSTTPEPAQVMVGFLRQGNRPDGRYIALAIHDQTRLAGRRAERISYFCASYDRLADTGIGYLAMYQALRKTSLRPEVGPPLAVSVVAPGLLSPAVGPLAVEVAALLLTRHPVCVLGAQKVPVLDRLAFIDTVLALLPYGLRSTLTATTWINSSKEQTFRLFFSSERRTRHPDDHVVAWDKPDKEAIPAEPAYVRAYYDWLTETAGEPTTRLAGLVSPIGFRRQEPLVEVLRQAGVPVDELASGESEASEQRTTKEILFECIGALGTPAEAALGDKIIALRVYAEHGEGRAEDRERYQRIVTEYELLRPGLWDEFYYTVIRLAFGTPFGYDAYCQLEDCLAVTAPAAHPAPPAPQPPAVPQPHPALLRAIDRALKADHARGIADARVAAVAAAFLDDAQRDDWSRAGLLDAAELVRMLAAAWDRPRHEELVLDAIMNRFTAAMQAPDGTEAQRALAALRATLTRAEPTGVLRTVLAAKTDDTDSEARIVDWPSSLPCTRSPGTRLRWQGDAGEAR